MLVFTYNNRKRPLDDDRTMRPYFEVNRDEKGKQIVSSDGRIKCTMCGGRYYEKGIKAHSISCKKKRAFGFERLGSRNLTEYLVFRNYKKNLKKARNKKLINN